jgi:hypothetical protein
MQLLTAELRASLPPLYAQDGNKDPIVHALCCRQHKACYVPAEIMLWQSSGGWKRGRLKPRFCFGRQHNSDGSESF